MPRLKREIDRAPYAGGVALPSLRPSRTAPASVPRLRQRGPAAAGLRDATAGARRSEEHTSELQSHSDLVCRLLLEKKKNRSEKASYVGYSRVGKWSVW